MMKFRVTDHSGINMNDSISSTVNLTSKYLPSKPGSRRRHSLIVEDTGRFNCRRSSAPAVEFLSIKDLNNSDVECVSFSKKRVIETDDDIESDLEYLGHTSASFVFKGQNDGENSYRGFSNFDDIVLNDGCEQNDTERFETVSDSGMGSWTSSLASNYFKLRPLQTVSDLTDLGFQSWRPKNFSLSHLRKRSFEVQSGRPVCSRYKWRFGYFQLVLAYVSFSLGMRPIVEAEESRGGAFFVAHAIMMVAVGLPLSYLLSVIAQFSGGGCLQVWKMVPAAWGIGLAVVVTMLINATINAVTVAYAFYYFIFVVQSYLPWEECNPIYAADSQCQVAQFCYGQVCQSTMAADRGAKPTFQFWRHYVNGDNGNNVYQSYGYPKWDLLIGLYLCWFLVTLMTCKGMKTLSKIICLLSIVALLLLLILLGLNHQSFQGATYIKMFAFLPADEIMQLDLWTKAACLTAKSLATSIGALTCLSSYNKAEIRPAKMISLIIFANLIITWLSILLGTVYGIQKTAALSSSQEDHIFDLFMDEMNAPARAGVFIVFIIITKLNAIAILTDSVISSLTDSLSWMANYRLLTFVIYCFASFLLGLFLIVPNGYQLLANTRVSVEAASVVLFPLMLLTILYCYGLHRLSDNVYVMTGSSLLGLSKLWLSAFLPGLLVPIMVSYFHHSKFYYDATSMEANLHVYGLMLLIVLLPLGYATWITSRALCKCDSIKALFTATPGWPQETQSKYAHTASFERYVNNRVMMHDNLAMNEF